MILQHDMKSKVMARSIVYGSYISLEYVFIEFRVLYVQHARNKPRNNEKDGLKSLGSSKSEVFRVAFYQKYALDGGPLREKRLAKLWSFTRFARVPLSRSRIFLSIVVSPSKFGDS